MLGGWTREWVTRGKRDGGVWAVGWQGAQDVKRSERPRPVSAGAAARNPARTYDLKLLTLNGPLDRALDARAPKMAQSRVISRDCGGTAHATPNSDGSAAVAAAWRSTSLTPRITRTRLGPEPASVT